MTCRLVTAIKKLPIRCTIRLVCVKGIIFEGKYIAYDRKKEEITLSEGKVIKTNKKELFFPKLVVLVNSVLSFNVEEEAEEVSISEDSEDSETEDFRRFKKKKLKVLELSNSSCSSAEEEMQIGESEIENHEIVNGDTTVLSETSLNSSHSSVFELSFEEDVPRKRIPARKIVSYSSSDEDELVLKEDVIDKPIELEVPIPKPTHKPVDPPYDNEAEMKCIKTVFNRKIEAEKEARKMRHVPQKLPHPPARHARHARNLAQKVYNGENCIRAISTKTKDKFSSVPKESLSHQTSSQ